MNAPASAQRRLKDLRSIFSKQILRRKLWERQTENLAIAVREKYQYPLRSKGCRHGSGKTFTVNGVWIASLVAGFPQASASDHNRTDAAPGEVNVERNHPCAKQALLFATCPSVRQYGGPEDFGGSIRQVRDQIQFGSRALMSQGLHNGKRVLIVNRRSAIWYRCCDL